MYKMVGIVVAYLIGGMFFFSCNQDSSNPNIIIVGTNSEFPPFSFKIHGELVGFDIDIAKEVCKRMNKTISFKDMPFDALIPDLTFGNIDFIAAGMSFTNERAQRVSFTKSYLNDDPLVILTLASDDPNVKINLDFLSNKIIVVNEGYTADLFLSGKPNLQLLRLSSPADAFLALKIGRADAFVTAQSTLHSFLETDPTEAYQIDKIEGAVDNCALVVSKNKPILLEEIQKSLDAMEVDGTLTQYKTKWKLK